MFSSRWRPIHITLGALHRDGPVSVTLPCLSIELRAVEHAGVWQWIVRVGHTQDIGLADWQTFSLVDSGGIRRTYEVEDVQQISPGLLSMVPR